MKAPIFALHVYDGTRAGTVSDALSESIIYTLYESSMLNLETHKFAMDIFCNSDEMQSKHRGNDSFPECVNDMAFCVTEYHNGVHTPICWWNFELNKWDFTD